MTDLEITPEEFAKLRLSGQRHRLIDVREPSEVRIAHLEGAEEIPMGSVPAALPALDTDDGPLVVMCHHGVRSLHVVYWLREQGVADCRSLAGGIERWSREIDPEIPRY